MAIVIIGMTEGGYSALSAPIQQRIAKADHVIAANRFHAGLPDGPQIEDWPSPFTDIFTRIKALDGRKLVLLATGDPLWYGAGASILGKLGADKCEIICSVSGFQMAATRMGWPLAGCQTLSIHGRPVEGVLPNLYPRARLLLLTENGKSLARVANLLVEAGYGPAKLSVLAHIGGDQEARWDGIAADWAKPDSMPDDLPDFHILAIDCGDCVAPATGQILADDALENSGKLTKRDARASALAKLAPFPGAVMWDVGSGSGAIAIDFLRQAPRGTAFAIDRDPAQIAMATRNAIRCGVPHLQNVQADLPDGLDDLPCPDAIFIGGGLTAETAGKCMSALRLGGVLVAHCVTIESEAILIQMWQQSGGNLARLSIHHADPVGSFHGWRPLMPVTQWHWIKTVEPTS